MWRLSAVRQRRRGNPGACSHWLGRTDPLIGAATCLFQAPKDTNEVQHDVPDHQPYDGEVVDDIDEHDDAQLEAKLAAADLCFKTDWSARSFAQRKAVLSRAAALMRERSQSLAGLDHARDGQADRSRAPGEVALSAADPATTTPSMPATFFATSRSPPSSNSQCVVESRSVGVLSAEPWNFPYLAGRRVSLAPN